jgi:hypothetical protein
MDKPDISPHCERILENPPHCWDFRGARSFCLCWAWQEMQQKKLQHLPLHEAWMRLREVCKMGD